MEDLSLLKEKVRPFDAEKDKDLPQMSYSRLDTGANCLMKYNLKYIQKQSAPQDSIALSLGTLCHKVLELKARFIIDKEDVDYKFLEHVLFNGIEETTDKGSEYIQGVEQIKKHFGYEIWYEPDNASGINYEEKIHKFRTEIIPNYLNDISEWKPFETEMRFDFVYNYGTKENPKEIHFFGFIDIAFKKLFQDILSIKVGDYKTSKKVFDKVKVTTSLQHFIYGLAIYVKYGILPEKYEYFFVLINEFQMANTKGYLERGLKKLDKILNTLDLAQKDKEYKPSPSPLCYWCDYCYTNPNAVEPYKNLCKFYSLWKPSNKTYLVNQKWEDRNKIIKAKRKFVF